MNLSAVLILCGCVLLSTVSSLVPGYSLSNVVQQPWGLTGDLTLIPGSQGPYGGDVTNLKLAVWFQTSDILHLRIYDPNNNRWQVPGIVQVENPTNKPAVMNYTLSYIANPFGFAVSRSSGGQTIFNTSSPANNGFNGLIFESQYIEISTQTVTNPNIYGLGERIHNYRLDPNFKTYGMWNRDQGTPVDQNLYGTHPIYLQVMNGTGLSHGVFLLNSNAMNVYITPQSLTYKTIGGILDFWFFMGPNPDQVVQQYTSIIGRPHLPPYWSLGWHQCRYGYHSVEETTAVVQNYTRFDIPLDTIWNDIDYMDAYKDFTFSPTNFPTPQMQQFVNSVHEQGKHYVMIIDPGIANQDGYAPYDQGNQAGVWVQDCTGKSPAIGKVWPGSVVFPDFSHPKCYDWWAAQISSFHQTGVPFDGIWIDMNEISNFCTGDCNGNPCSTNDPYDNPPYDPVGAPLNASTISINAQLYAGVNYNTHNLYGLQEAEATSAALESLLGVRSFVLSRSTYPSAGKYTAHWLGDNTSTFQDMFYSISGILSFQLFGVPQVGVDVCGFSGNTTPELCARWTELAVFYPFARNHNSITSTPQEPWKLGQQTLEISRNMIRLRYYFLPFLYSLFFDAHAYGSTVWKALVFEYPQDAQALFTDRQFMVGSAILVSPVLDQGATTVTAYFPADRWYDFYTGQVVGSTSSGQYITLSAPLDKLNIHLRGGFIVPAQLPALTTKAARANPFELLVALSPSGTAAGVLYLDDGESLNTLEDDKYTEIEFQVSQNAGTFTLASKLVLNGFSGTANAVLGAVNIYGSPSGRSVTVNGRAVQSFYYDGTNQRLGIDGLTVPLGQPLTIVWN